MIIMIFCLIFSLLEIQGHYLQYLQDYKYTTILYYTISRKIVGKGCENYLPCKRAKYNTPSTLLTFRSMITSVKGLLIMIGENYY